MNPGDIPAERPASLDRLDVLIGAVGDGGLLEGGYFGRATAESHRLRRRHELRLGPRPDQSEDQGRSRGRQAGTARRYAS
jgi:hypothetical protein